MSTLILASRYGASEYGHSGANPRLLLSIAWILTVVDAMVFTVAFPLLYEGYGLLLGGLLIVALGLAGFFSLLKMWTVACIRFKATELHPQRMRRAA